MSEEREMLLCLLYIYSLCVYTACACGAGGSGGVNIRAKKFHGDRIPDVAETSASASGRFDGELSVDDESLKKIISTDIIFEDPRFDADSRKAIVPCEEAIIKLASVIRVYWKRQFKLYVKEGYLSTKKAKHRENSMHYAGRAFDITLIDNKAPKTRGNKARTVEYHVLRILAGLAYYNTKFSFVEVKRRHVHVSCSKKTSKKSASRCFHGNGKVRTSDGRKIAIKDIKVGDKVLTMGETGAPIYSEVVMMMHRNKNTIVDDYLQISTHKGHKIILSGHHLIFTEHNSNAIFSRNVRIGQSLLTYDGVRFSSSIVTNISSVVREGVYAPLTAHGTIVVDDVYSSCYALFPSHTISHYVFWVWRSLYPLLKHFDFVHTREEYHWYADVFRKSINTLNIFPYSM